MASAIELLTIEIAEYHWAASTMAGGSRPGRGTKRPCPRLSNLTLRPAKSRIQSEVGWATDLGNRSDAEGTMAAIGTTRIEDRVWIVTGASSGIGKATAVGLARLGGTVVLACRDQARGEAAQREVVEESKNPHVTLMLVDLASQASIIAF